MDFSLWKSISGLEEENLEIFKYTKQLSFKRKFFESKKLIRRIKMIGIMVVGILIVLAVIMIRMNHFRHKITILLLLVFALFLYTTITVVDKVNDFDLTTSEGFFDAGKVYLGWLGNGFSNLKSLAGNAIKMDWASTNGTFFSEEIEQEKK